MLDVLDGGTPIHQLMVENNVTIFFHGRDHFFAKEEKDGVIYQGCPMPSDSSYGRDFTIDTIILEALYFPTQVIFALQFHHHM